MVQPAFEKNSSAFIGDFQESRTKIISMNMKFIARPTAKQRYTHQNCNDK